MHKKIIIISPLIFISAMIFIWSEANRSQRKEELFENSRGTETEQKTEWTVEGAERGWKDYNNQEFGYSFEYPSEWELFTSAPLLKWSFFDQGQVVAVRWFKEGEPISYFMVRPFSFETGEARLNEAWQVRVFVAGLEGLEVISNESTDFQGYSAQKLVFHHAQADYKEVSYFVLKENIVYEITGASLDFEKEDFDYMFLNFRF